MAEGKDGVEKMAIVITNGDLYIYLNRYGKYRKTDNEAEALLYQNVDRAIAYMEIAPKKTRGYYVLDTETRKVLWSRQERKIERKRERVKYERKKFSIDTKKMLYLNAGGRCALCGRKLTLEEATLDHIVPLFCGGADSVENLQICCEEDNLFKGSILPEDFFERITKIFMYQMEKKNGKTLKWKLIQHGVKKLVGQQIY